jgi:hypothetical protein
MAQSQPGGKQFSRPYLERILSSNPSTAKQTHTHTQRERERERKHNEPTKHRLKKRSRRREAKEM